MVEGYMEKDTEIFLTIETTFEDGVFGRPVYIYCKDGKPRLYPEPTGEYELIFRHKE